MVVQRVTLSLHTVDPGWSWVNVSLGCLWVLYSPPTFQKQASRQIWLHTIARRLEYLCAYGALWRTAIWTTEYSCLMPSILGIGSNPLQEKVLPEDEWMNTEITKRHISATFFTTIVTHQLQDKAAKLRTEKSKVLSFTDCHHVIFPPEAFRSHEGIKRKLDLWILAFDNPSFGKMRGQQVHTLKCCRQFSEAPLTLRPASTFLFFSFHFFFFFWQRNDEVLFSVQTLPLSF